MSQFRRRPQPPEIVEAEQIWAGAHALAIWVVTFPSGSRSVYPEKRFRELYEPIERVGIMATLDLEGDAR